MINKNLSNPSIDIRTRGNNNIRRKKKVVGIWWSK
jgi:hypothetical protein